MGHRHFQNSFHMFEGGQHQFRTGATTEQPYDYRGRVVASHNSSFYRMENLMNGEQEYPSHSTLSSGPNVYPISNIRMEVPHFQLAASHPSCDYPTSSSVTGSFHQPPGNCAGPQYSGYYNRRNFYEVDDGTQDPASSTVRGPFKRKTPGISVGSERGCASRFFSEGSSSHSGLQQDKPFENYQDIPATSVGLQPYTCSSLPFAAEDTTRNVRSRSVLNLGPPSVRNHLNFPSQDYNSSFPMNHCGTSSLGSLTAPATSQVWNSASQASRGNSISDTNGTNSETDHLVVQRRIADVGHPSHGSLFSGNALPTPQFLQDPSSHILRERLCSRGQGTLPPYLCSSSHRPFGYEAAASDGGLRLLSETYHSRYSRSSSSGLWHGNYWNERLVTAAERPPSHTTATDFSDRMTPETLVIADHTNFYSLRDIYDQYGDMRLDIDNMSYEELLALGERIGNVSTGLSEDMMSKCLMEIEYTAHAQNQDEGSCAICLEELSGMEQVGRLKNCGHDYHVSCIKRWLSMKNACPICKGPAVVDA
ncbi:hypothetical protein Ancab_023523 [Ancistrocladus abbreviatus]